MATFEQQEERRGGRPRSREAQQAILAAALEVLTESGYEAMGIEQVVAGSGRRSMADRGLKKNW
jgi:AcrR family transcriptional regulator